MSIATSSTANIIDDTPSEKNRYSSEEFNDIRENKDAMCTSQDSLDDKPDLKD